MSNPEAFRRAISRFTRRALAQSDEPLQVLVEFIFVSVRDTTPVWSGRARASWRVSTGTAPDLSTADETGQPLSIPSPPVPPVIGTLKRGTTVWVTNNVPYALDLEHANPRVYGTFVQGSHMVATAVGRAQAAWPGIVRRSRGEDPRTL